MNNGFPYWQFHNDKWLTGKVSAFDLDEQGLFLQFCMAAWASHGVFNICSTSVQRRFRKSADWVADAVKAMSDVGILIADGSGYRIKFIDEQLAKLDAGRFLKSKAGKASAALRAARNTESEESIQENTTQENTSVLKNVQQVLNGCSTGVEASCVELQAKATKRHKSRPLSENPPTFEEVAAYAKERCEILSADEFYDGMLKSNWTDKNRKPLYDWKATYRTWEKFRKINAATLIPQDRPLRHNETSAYPIPENKDKWDGVS